MHLHFYIFSCDKKYGNISLSFHIYNYDGNMFSVPKLLIEYPNNNNIEYYKIVKNTNLKEINRLIDMNFIKTKLFF